MSDPVKGFSLADDTRTSIKILSGSIAGIYVIKNFFSILHNMHQLTVEKASCIWQQFQSANFDVNACIKEPRNWVDTVTNLTFVTGFSLGAIYLLNQVQRSLTPDLKPVPKQSEKDLWWKGNGCNSDGTFAMCSGEEARQWAKEDWLYRFEACAKKAGSSMLKLDTAIACNPIAVQKLAALSLETYLASTMWRQTFSRLEYLLLTIKIIGLSTLNCAGFLIWGVASLVFSSFRKQRDLFWTHFGLSARSLPIAGLGVFFPGATVDHTADLLWTLYLAEKNLHFSEPARYFLRKEGRAILAVWPSLKGTIDETRYARSIVEEREKGL